MEMDLLLSQIIAGLVRGSLLFLITVGLTLIFSILGVLNVAHVSFFAIAAYLTYTFWAMLQDYNFSYWVAIPLTMLAIAALGAIVELVLIRHLYKRETAELLLVTFALVYVFSDLVKMSYGVTSYSIKVEMLNHPLATIGATTIPVSTVLAIAVAIVVAVGLWVWLQKTKSGRTVRAVQSEREMASALGIRVPLIRTSVFVLSAALAGLAGTLWMAANVAQAYVLDLPFMPVLFVIMVVGGMGSLIGTFVAAMLFGEVFALSVVLLPRAGMVILFATAFFVLIIRPWGFFGTKGRLE